MFVRRTHTRATSNGEPDQRAIYDAHGRKTLDAFVKEYESQLLTMAKKLEEIDNDGSNPTEITQAHVEQASLVWQPQFISIPVVPIKICEVMS